MEIEKILKWLPLLIAFIAGFFALHQIKSNNITNARIKWLKAFKQIITDFFSESSVIQIKEGVVKGISKNENLDDRLQQINDNLTISYFEHLRAITSKYYLIKLNLNPKENLHQKLEVFLDEYMKLLNQIPHENDKSKFSQLLKDLNDSSDKIILLIRFLVKLEWEKTKRSYINRIIYFSFGKGKKLLNEALIVSFEQNKK